MNTNHATVSATVDMFTSIEAARFIPARQLDTKSSDIRRSLGHAMQGIWYPSDLMKLRTRGIFGQIRAAV